MGFRNLLTPAEGRQTELEFMDFWHYYVSEKKNILFHFYQRSHAAQSTTLGFQISPGGKRVNIEITLALSAMFPPCRSWNEGGKMEFLDFGPLPWLVRAQTCPRPGSGGRSQKSA